MGNLLTKLFACDHEINTSKCLECENNALIKRIIQLERENINLNQRISDTMVKINRIVEKCVKGEVTV